MAIGGRNMLGAGVDPRLFSYDFSGAYKIGENYAQAIQGIGQSIASGIEDYKKAKKQASQYNAQIKTTDALIDSAITFFPENKDQFEAIKTSINDPSKSPMERAMEASQVSDLINNSMNMMKMRASMRIDEQEAATARIKALGDLDQERMKPPTIQEFGVPGGKQQMQWNAETQSWEPISISQGSFDASLLPEKIRFLADDFQRAGQKYGVDPKVLAAISMHETANGTSNAFRNKNNAMGVSDASGPIQMGSHAESIDRMAKLLSQGQQGKGPYAGRITIDQIADVYAPVGAKNDPGNLNRFWAQGVARNIERLGGVPSAQIGFTPTRTTGEEKGQWKQNVQSGGLFGQQNSATGEFKPYPGQGKSGVNVNVAGSAPAPPQGYRNVFDDAGNLVRQEVIPGGPAAQEEEAKKAQEETSKAQALESATAVLADLDRFISATERMSNLPLASVARKKMAAMGFEQQAEVENMLATIKANLRFDMIKQLKAASPTGSTGLGAVTQIEFDALGAALGQLSQVGDPDVQRERALALRNKFLDTIHGDKKHRDNLLEEGKVTRQQYDAIQSLYSGPKSSLSISNADRQARIEELRSKYLPQ